MLPYVNPFAFDGEANFGDYVQLTCLISKGDLPLNIQWLFDNHHIHSHLGIITTKMGDRSSFLAVPEVREINTGNYTCLAKNDAGQSNFTTQLFVNGLFYTILIYTHIYINSILSHNEPFLANLLL